MHSATARPSEDAGHSATAETAEASAVVSGAEYRYAIDAEGNARILSCTAEAAEIEIPGRIEGHAVVAIGDEAFSATRTTADPGAPWGPGTVSAGFAGAFAGKLRAERNTQLERVGLPEGIAFIGRGAFRGCRALREVDLPASLREIADFAFSRTAISSLRIPAACTEIGGRSLWLGSEALPGVHAEYRSPLQDIQVDDGNPRFRTIGGMLCRRRNDGAASEGASAVWEVLLAPGRAARASIPDHAEIGEDALCGVDRIGTLSVPDGAAVRCKEGLLPGGTCDCLEIRFPQLPDSVTLSFPDDSFARTVLDATKGAAHFDGKAVVTAYDGALDAAQQGFDPARLMAARLASPALLAERFAASFRAKLDRALESLCAHFGARAQWDGFELLADAGLLDEAGIGRAIEALNALGDAAAVSYLLALKRRRYGKATWTYEL